MQRAVFKENVLNQPLVNIGIDNFTGTNDIVKRYITLHNDQGPYFLLSHTDASHHNRHDIIMLEFFFFVAGKETYQGTGVLVRTQGQQKAPDLILKQNNQRQDSHTHQFVENGAQELHLEHLRYNQPNKNKHQDTGEHINRSGGFHQLISVIKQESH